METKDIQCFLEAEKNFCKEHPDYGKYRFDDIYGMSYVGDDDRAEFLVDKPFSKHLKHGESIYGKEETYGLTKAERMLLSMFYNNYSSKFRDDYYLDRENMPEVISEMFVGINNVVAKAPLNKDKVLYRFCMDKDKKDMVVGEVVCFPYNLTCTNYDWHQEKYNNVYVITPLSNGKTKAHNLFEIYEHGDEKQVDFLRNTSFKVTKVEATEGTEFKKYYLSEL